MKLYKHENILVRMEVMRGSLPEGKEQELDWTLEIDRADTDTVVLSGSLFRMGEFGFGQALVLAIVKDSQNGEITEDLEFFSTWAQEVGCVEAMYDTCRRSISSQASVMDFDLELPTKAPEVDIVVKSADLTDAV